jgi:hypothetical protein
VVTLWSCFSIAVHEAIISDLFNAAASVGRRRAKSNRLSSRTR